ncbi:MAG TPA: CHAT domain-containing protein [Streptosporangiaceae bacterium]|nr:CHAT domain-containing protein [Streptosporangiaceae bacterium]
MTASARDLDVILAQVAELLAVHRIPAAERLLADLLTDSSVLAAATPERRCRVYLEWGWIHGATQRYQTAREALGAAVAAAETLRPRNLLCEALRESAVVARYEGDFSSADTLLEHSELIAWQEGYDLELGQALFLRATIAHHRGAFAHARDLLRQAAEAAGRCPPTAESGQLRADICREQAVSARIARDYDAARGLLAEARDRYERLGRRVGMANAERELGAVLEQVGDDAGARRHYLNAFTAYLRTGRQIGAAQVARRVGHLDLIAGLEDHAALARAGRRFAQALRLGEGEPTNAALTTLFQGQLARQQGDLDAAERLLDEAVHRYADLGEAQDVARDLSQVALEYGLVARDRGERAKAISLFREALGALREADDPGPASLAHFHLAFELIQADEVSDALQHAVASFMLNEANGRRLQDPAERRSFYGEHRDTYGLAMHCAARAHDGRTAFTIAMAARSEALAAFVRAGARLAPQLQGLIDEIALAAAEAEQPAAGQHSTAAARLNELYARLEHQTSRQMRQTMTERGADPDEIIATLPEGGHALLLDVLEEDDTICNRVWISPAGEIQVDEVIFPAPVRHFLDSYHYAREEAAWQPQHDELAELGRAVLPPGLAAALNSGVNPPLIISTGSLLGPVPVAALRINERYLAEQAQLALVPSMALWAAVRMRPARTGCGTLAFLDPGLPSSQREEAALRAALSPVRRVDSRQLRTDLADASQYAAVVISAHGTPPGDSEMPGSGRGRHAGLAQALALAGGERLTAAELLTCRLPDALITPSCWSARLTVRAAVEPLGLPTAALAAGARWVLAGTVDIGDTTTASLMSAFYKRLSTGFTPAAALQRAQVSFLRPRPQTTPGTWAGLTIVGDGFTPLGMRR